MSEFRTPGEPEKKSFWSKWISKRNEPQGIQGLHSGGNSPEENPLRINGIPAADALARFHEIRTGNELGYQIRQPETPETAMDEEQTRIEAFNLLGNLTDKLQTWEPKEPIALEDGSTLTNYSTRVPLDKGKTRFFEAQVVRHDEIVTSGSVTETGPNEDTGDFMREHFFRASVGQNKEGPSVYYIEHPYHLEDLGIPMRNTRESVTVSQRLIDRLPEIG